MTADQKKIYDMMVRHRILIQRYAMRQAELITATLNESNKEVAGILAEDVPDVLSTARFTKAQKRATDRLQARIQAAILISTLKAEKEFMAEMDGFVDSESSFLKKLFLIAVAASVISQIGKSEKKRILEQSKFSGSTVPVWFKNHAAKETAKVVGRVNYGIANSEEASDVTTAIIGTSKANRMDGLIVPAAIASGMVIARTLVNGFSNETAQAFYKENEGIIEVEVFTAVLDDRTSEICASLDGTKYFVGTGFVPPLHPNCRSMRVPYIVGVD